MVDHAKKIGEVIANERAAFKESSKHLTIVFPTPEHVLSAKKIVQTFGDRWINGNLSPDEQNIRRLAASFDVVVIDSDSPRVFWNGKLHPWHEVCMNDRGELITISKAPSSEAGDGGFNYEQEITDAAFVQYLENFDFRTEDQRGDKVVELLNQGFSLKRYLVAL